MRSINFKLALMVGLIALASSQSSAADPYCTTTWNNPILYLSNETYIHPVDQYIQGINMQYSISTSKGSTVSSNTNIFTQSSSAPSTLTTIVSSSITISIQNQYTYSVLENNSTNYNVYVQQSSSISVPPGFTVPTVTLSSASQTCLSTTNVAPMVAVVSCYIWGGLNPSSYINTYYVINAAATPATQTQYNFSNWDQSWNNITSRKVVPFNLFQDTTDVYLAVFTPNTGVVSNTAFNNFVDIYVYYTSNSSFTSIVRLNANTFGSNVPWQISDLAATGNTLYLLNQNSILPLVYNYGNKTALGTVTSLNYTAYKIAVYQNGQTTNVAVTNFNAILVYVFDSSNNQLLFPMPIDAFITELVLQNSQNLYINAQFVVLQRNSLVLTFTLANYAEQYGQSQYYVFGSIGAYNNYLFTLLPNNIAAFINPTNTTLYTIGVPTFTISSANTGDTVVLTGQSIVGLNQTSCTVTFNINQVGNVPANWGVYNTNTQVSPNISVIYNQSLYLNLEGMFTGWNLTYGVSNQGSNTWNTNYVTSKAFQTSLVFDPNTASPANTVFTQSFSNSLWNTEGVYLLFTQDSTNQIYMQSCFVNGTKACTLLNNPGAFTQTLVSVANTIVQSVNGNSYLITAFAYANNQTVDYFISRQNPNSFLVYKSSIKFSGPVNAIMFTGSVLSTAIPSTNQVYFNYFIIDSNQNLDIIPVSTVDSLTAANWPQGSTSWTPINIHASNQDPNRVVVECTNGLYTIGIGYQEVSVFFLNYISLTSNVVPGPNPVWSRAVTLFANHMVIVELSNTGESLITEYALFNLYNPVLTKNYQFPSNNASLVFPLVSTYNQNSRLLYLLGNITTSTSTRASGYYIYVYRVGAPDISSLYLAPWLNLNSLTGNFFLTVSTLSGDNFDELVFISTANNQSISWIVPQEPNIVVTSLYNPTNNVQYQSYTANLVANSSNYAPAETNNNRLFLEKETAQSTSMVSAPNSAYYNYTVNVLNSQEIIYSLPNTNGNLNCTGIQGSTVPLYPSQYFGGTALDFYTNTQGFSILGKVNNLNNHQPITTSPQLSSTTAYQGEIFTLSGNGEIYSYDLNTNSSKPLYAAQTNLTCFGIQVQNFNLPPQPNTTNQTIFIFSSCVNSFTLQWSLTVLNYTQFSQSIAVGNSWRIILPGVAFLELLYPLSPFNYVVFDGSTSLLNAAQGSIQIFTVTSLINNGLATLQNTISAGVCGISRSNVNLVFADVGYTNFNIYNLFILDNLSNNLYVVPVSNNTFNCSSQSTSVINLPNYLQNNNAFLPTGNIFAGVQVIIGSNVYNNNVTSARAYTLLLMSLNAPIYQFVLTMDAQTYQLTNGGVTAIYNNFPNRNLVATSFERSYQNSFSVNYAQPNGQGFFTAIYDFNNTNPLSTYSNTALLTPISHIIASQVGPLTVQENLSLLYWFTFQNYSLSFIYLQPVSSSVQVFNYTQFISIYLNQPITQQTANLQVVAQNPYFNSSANVNLYISNPPNPVPYPVPASIPSQSSTSAFWYWIIIACIIISIAIVVAFVLTYKARQKEMDNARQYLVEDA